MRAVRGGLLVVAFGSFLGVGVEGGGGSYGLLNRLIGSLKFDADTSHIDDVTVTGLDSGPVKFDVYVRLPPTVTCAEFGVASIDATGKHMGKQDGMDRYDLSLSANGLRFKCNVSPLCIKTSLPLNDWDCEG